MEQLNGINYRIDADFTENDSCSGINCAHQFHNFASLE